ncbi:hypothetical protein R1flu_021025 [Riccia fluitans]|uniref:Uncharacterized protein n=1 Tax=Riccia fluitans TaxID=41844 RepID=A0ABD1ZPD6_9MARC
MDGSHLLHVASQMALPGSILSAEDHHTTGLCLGQGPQCPGSLDCGLVAASKCTDPAVCSKRISRAPHNYRELLSFTRETCGLKQGPLRVCRCVWSAGFLSQTMHEVNVDGSVCKEQGSLDISDIEEEFGVDMCPECKLFGKVELGTGKIAVHPVPVEPTAPLIHDEDLGADMCPEKVVPHVPPRKHPASSLDTDSYGVDMCPEKGQPMGSFVETQVDKQSIDLATELQALMRVQQSQIDQLAEFIQHLRSRSNGDLRPPPEDQGRTQLPVEEKEGAEHSRSETTSSTEPKNSSEQQDSKLVAEELAGTDPDLKLCSSGTGKKMPITAESSGSVSRGITVARYKPAWAEHFGFLSAVKVDGEVSCLHVLPQEGEDGISRYVVVGDMTGRLYIFVWLGDLLLEHITMSSAPITAMMSYIVLKNETILVTGHADGSVLVHRVWEAVEHGQDDSAVLTIEHVHSLVPPSSRTLRTGSESVKSDHPVDPAPFASEKEKSTSDVIGAQSVTNLKMYKVGKMRYTLVSDQSGKIQLFRDNGSLYGTADSPHLPLDFMRTPTAQRLIFLTDTGVGSLDLRTMQVRSSPCEGLNSSTVTAYAFDVVGRSKANGFTADGDLVYVGLTGDMLHSECQVKKRRKVEVPGPFFPQALKGYMLAVTPDHVLVYNTTLHMGFNYGSTWIGGPRPLFSVSMGEIAQSFLKNPVAKSRWPVMASNRDKLVVIGFGHGYVAMFRSNLPVFKPVDFSAKVWSSPILIGVIALVVVWQLISKARQPATIIADYPYGGPGFRKMDPVNFGGRSEERTVVSEPRRFRSPTRGYVAPNPGSFKSGTLSFRSSTVDSGSYSARREPLFASNQPVGDLREPEVERKELTF